MENLLEKAVEANKKLRERLEKAEKTVDKITDQQLEQKIGSAYYTRLTEDQKRILRKVYHHLPSIENNPIHLFVTGGAGCGKTVLVKFLAVLIDSYFHSKNSCLILVPTGIAAFIVDGRTIHSVFEIVPNVTLDTIFCDPDDGKISRLKETLENKKFIFIDEIGMVSPDILADVDFLLRKVKMNNQPFGGLSIITFGDFYLLPPFNDRFVFEGVSLEFLTKWRKTEPIVDNLWKLFKIEELTENVRTPDRNEANLLENIRQGKATEEDKTWLRQNLVEDFETVKDIFERHEALEEANPEKTIAILAARKDTIEYLNDCKFDKAEEKVTFEPIHSVRGDSPIEGKPETLRTAIGLKIMLTRNMRDISPFAVNGCIGRFEGVQNGYIKLIVRHAQGTLLIPRVLYRSGRKYYEQYPVIAAEAITIHKSQGCTFDGLIGITDGIFANGHFYTLLSRARDLKLCRLTSLEGIDKVSKEVEDHLDKMRTERLFPRTPDTI